MWSKITSAKLGCLPRHRQRPRWSREFHVHPWPCPSVPHIQLCLFCCLFHCINIRVVIFFLWPEKNANFEMNTHLAWGPLNYLMIVFFNWCDTPYRVSHGKRNMWSPTMGLLLSINHFRLLVFERFFPWFEKLIELG